MVPTKLTHKDFIDPFLETLRWDMNNKQSAWEVYRGVIHEDKLKEGGVIKGFTLPGIKRR